MKRNLLLTVLFSIILTACAAPTPTAAPSTSTPHAVPFATEAPVVATEAPTQLPTEIPTSPTPDRPAPGVSTRIENGFTYTWTEVTDSLGNKIEGWFRPFTIAPIPIRDAQGNIAIGAGQTVPAVDYGYITVFAEMNSGTDAIKSLTHTNNIDMNGKFGRTLLPYLYKRNNTPLSDQFDFNKGIIDDNMLTIPFNYIPQKGDKVTFGLGPKHGVDVYILSSDHLNTSETDGYSRWDLYNKGHYFRSAFFGVSSQGNAIGTIISEKPFDQLSDKEIRMVTLFHMLGIIQQEDVSNLKPSDALGFLSQDDTAIGYIDVIRK